MKRLILTLFVLVFGYTSFANDIVENECPSQISPFFRKYEYRIEVWRDVPYTNPQQLQLLHRESGCNTDSWVVNRIQQLKGSYPGADVGNWVLRGSDTKPCEIGVFEPFDPIVRYPIENVFISVP